MADIFRGRIIDVTDNTYTIELTGTGGKLDAFIEALDQSAILETVRTGASGIGRGERVLRFSDVARGLRAHVRSVQPGQTRGHHEGLLRQGRRSFARQGTRRSRSSATARRAMRTRRTCRTPASRSRSALRKGGASWDKAKKAGVAVKVAELGDAIKGADIVMVLLPDEHHAGDLQGHHRAEHQERRRRSRSRTASTSTSG